MIIGGACGGGNMGYNLQLIALTTNKNILLDGTSKFCMFVNTKIDTKEKKWIKI